MPTYPARRLLVCVACILAMVSSVRADQPNGPAEWKGREGEWDDASQWLGTPTPFNEVVIRQGAVRLGSADTYLAGDLEVAREAGEKASVEIDGATLILMQDSLFIGEHTGSDARFVLHAGALESVMDVFVGGATAGPGRANHALLEIDGGTFVARNLTIGLGFGAHSKVTIDGSQPTAVHLLDYCYIEAAQDPAGHPGESTLEFTLDQNGVTPVTIQSHRDGLRIIKDSVSHCRLAINLRGIPPRDDITLIASHRATEGTFDDLPEGASVTATFQGHAYRWSLTYRGGASKTDLVLHNLSEYEAGAPVTHTRAIPATPIPLWTEHPLFPGPVPSGTPAFPGAEGFGAYTPGGRGGPRIWVDNLNDDGPGSLRAAIATHGPRDIGFRVSGVIRLKSKIAITEPFLTIEGDAAPGAGILLWGHGLEVRTHDVVLRYLRIRIGEDDLHLGDKNYNYTTGDGEYALYFVEGASNCIADHLSLSWSTNKMLSTTKLCDRITIQWCLLSESLNFAHHAYASIAGGNRVTWHHNLFAHHQSRCVRFQGAVDADFRNNVVYDWGDTAGYGEFNTLNYIGNFLKPGPSTTQRIRLFHSGDKVVAPHSLYVADNAIDGEPAVDRDNWRGMGYYFERATVAASRPFPAPPVATDPPLVAYERVLADAGASRPVRDAVDARVVREVRARAGHIIQHVSDVGGGPELAHENP